MERIVLQEKKSLLLSIAIIFILFNSCTIYQSVPVEDGIYTSKKKKEIVVINKEQYEDYEDNYFTKKLYELENADDNELFTDVDSYFSDSSRTDTVYVNQQPWGQNNNTLVINIDNGWGFDPYWNNAAFWGFGIGPVWNPWFGRPWGWNRSWGFRRGWALGVGPFNSFYGAGFYDPFWGWGNPYFYGGFGFNRFHRNRGLAFNNRYYRYGRVYNNGRPRVSSFNRNSYNRRTLFDRNSRRVVSTRNRNSTRTRPNNSTRTRTRVGTSNSRRNSSTRTRTNSTRTRSRSYTPSRRSSSTRSSTRSRSSSRSRGSSRRGN